MIITACPLSPGMKDHTSCTPATSCAFFSDVKPSNILLPLVVEEEQGGQQHQGAPQSTPSLAFHAAKLADFGLAAPVAPRPLGRVLLPSPFASGRPLIPPSPFVAATPPAPAAPTLHPAPTQMPSSSAYTRFQDNSAGDEGGGGERGTKAGGTIAYAAPEVLDPGRGPVTPASDVWSLGVVMWECLTGQRPWQGHTSAAIMTAVVLQGRHLSVPDDDPVRFPSGVCHLLEGCWATEASRRLSAAEVAARCRELMGQMNKGTGQDT
jgi:serine/threonine protein kinase